MESTEQKLHLNKETAIDQVKRAYELLIRLEFLMPFMKLEGSRSELAFSLLNELLASFTAAMSILNSMQERSSEFIDCSPQPKKDSRNCFKRVKLEKDQANRERKNVEKTISCAPHNDGYQWRKYGEKKIRNSIFPRCYYRCTHHHSEQKCPAKKQVQQDGQDSSLFHVTYQGKHTCTSVTTPTLVLDQSTISQEEPSLIYESLPNLYDETMTKSSCESSNLPYSFLNRPQLKMVPQNEQTVECSNGISDMNSGWAIDSFDLEYGELLFVMEKNLF